MRLRLQIIAALIIPGLGPWCAQQRCIGVAAALLALSPLALGSHLSALSFVYSFAAAQLTALLLSARAEKKPTADR